MPTERDNLYCWFSMQSDTKCCRICRAASSSRGHVPALQTEICTANLMCVVQFPFLNAQFAQVFKYNRQFSPKLRKRWQGNDGSQSIQSCRLISYKAPLSHEPWTKRTTTTTSRRGWRWRRETAEMMLNYSLLMLQGTCTMIYVMLKWILFEVWLCVYALTAKRHVSLSLLHWYTAQLHAATQKCVELNWIYKALTPNIKSLRLGIGASTQSVRLVFHFTLYPTSIMKWIYI